VKILLVTHTWTPEDGVPQRRWAWLVKVLQTKGASVEVITSAEPPKQGEAQVGAVQSLGSTGKARWVQGAFGEMVCRPKRYRLGESITARAVGQALDCFAKIKAAASIYVRQDHQKPDVVIGTVPALSTALSTVAIAKMISRPYILDLRDAWPDLLRISDKWNNSVGTPSLREKFLTRAPFKMALSVVAEGFWLIVVKSKGVIVTSEAHKTHLLQQLENRSKGLVPKVVVVRNVFASNTLVARGEGYEGSDGSLRVLYAGTVGRAQNIQNAIQAVALAKKRGLNIHLRIIGNGAAWGACVKLAQQLDLPNVEFIPRIPPQDIEKHYEWADTALVHLTDWEPLALAIPSKTYELMNSGVPITAVGHGALPALVQTYSAGVTVPPNSPTDLADTWIEFSDKKENIQGSNTWDSGQVQQLAEERLVTLIDHVLGSK